MAHGNPLAWPHYLYLTFEIQVGQMIELMQHQKIAVQRVELHEGRYGLLHEPGTGKTLSTIAYVDKKKAEGFAWKTLVLAPKSILHCAWANDLQHFPQLTGRVVWAAKPTERRRLIAEPGADVYITNFETFKKHAADFIEAGVRRLVIDESSKVKTPDSQISIACHKFSDDMLEVIILSGTPAPNSPTEYWSQFRCLDRQLFGGNFWRFAYKYFSPIKRNISGTDRIVGWKPLAAMKAEFEQKLRSRSWSLRKADCLDLPEQTDIVREVELGSEEFQHYGTLLTELRIDLGNGNVLTPAMQSKAMKLRQITGGTLYHEGKAVIVGDSKLKELMSVLEEIGDQPVVIWAEFTSEINRIVEALAEIGRVGRIDGQVNGSTRNDYITAFQAGSLPYLVCQPAAAGHGITLTAASHAVYYSHGYSFETYQQSRDRIHRKGQKMACTYWHLIAPGTIDEKVLAALKQKRNGHDAIFDVLGTGGRLVEQVA